MLLEQLITARLNYEDREGSIAALSVYFPASSPLNDLIAAVMADSRYQAVSDCAIVSRVVVKTTLVLDGPEATALNSDCGVLVFDAGDFAGVSITIPGIKPQYTVTDGCFAGRQIDITNPDIVALSDLIIASGVITPDETPVLSLCSGHIAKLWFPLDRASG